MAVNYFTTSNLIFTFKSKHFLTAISKCTLQNKLKVNISSKCNTAYNKEIKCRKL